MKDERLSLRKAMNLAKNWGLGGFAVLVFLGAVFVFAYFTLSESKPLSQTTELTILNPHAHPQAGDNWPVSFEAIGTVDLTQNLSLIKSENNKEEIFRHA